MARYLKRYVLLWGLILGVPVVALAFTFNPIDVVVAGGTTVANGINDAGQIVGYFLEATQPGTPVHGFLWEEGRITVIDFPGTSCFFCGTFLNGINNAGQIVGYFSSPSGAGSFLWEDGRFTVIDVDGVSIVAQDINNAGQIVGTFGRHGVLWDQGRITVINVDGASDTIAQGINDAGQIVGRSIAVSAGVNVHHSFLLADGRFTVIDVDGATFTNPYGINNAGQIVGYFTAPSLAQGFLLADGRFTVINVDGATSTIAQGINNAGQIVGSFIDATGQHGFVTAPSAVFRIVQPADNEQFPLSTGEFTQTAPITFEAELLEATSSVQWTVTLAYATSGGRGAFQETRTFTTNSGAPTHQETYAGLGGRVTIQATDTTTGTTAQDVTIYVIGTAIPDARITARLVALYDGGATPNLMTGIAVRESGYQQFATRTLFGVRTLWPQESFDGGSHIGLMQMPTNRQNAWNWLTNTAGGVRLFANNKLRAAGRLTNRIIATHPGLRALAPVELEHMALVLYGPHASANLSRQYYAPVRDSAGGWDWAVNTAGNPEGVAYADYIFSHRR